MNERQLKQIYASISLDLKYGSNIPKMMGLGKYKKEQSNEKMQTQISTPFIHDVMENAMPKLPLKMSVDIGVGQTYSGAK